MNKVKVSFVVPIYKVQYALLEKCINSIREQTERRIEIILVDDGSPDDCGKICDEYSLKDDRVLVIHQRNKGVSEARNEGMRRSSGEYICFVDPDDIVMCDLAERTLQAIDRVDGDILVFKFINNREKVKPCSYAVEEIKNNEKSEICVQVMSMWDTEDSVGSCWGKLFKRDFLVRNNLNFVAGIKKAQDRIFMLDCYMSSGKCARFDYYGYVYTIDNETSICRRFNPEIKDILEETYGEFEKRADSVESKKALYNTCAMFMFECFLLYFCHKDNKDDISDKVKKLRCLVKEEPYKSAVRLADLKVIRKKCAVMIILLRMKCYRLCIRIMHLLV